jgi:hypothetical protein
MFKHVFSPITLISPAHTNTNQLRLKFPLLMALRGDEADREKYGPVLVMLFIELVGMFHQETRAILRSIDRLSLLHKALKALSLY